MIFDRGYAIIGVIYAKKFKVWVLVSMLIDFFVTPDNEAK
jgi:hypothetical protein